MSFGSTGSAVRRPSDDAVCPCGRRAFRQCCAPVLAGAAASTAEDLMRSRYTAFAIGDVAHLARSWHPRTRPAEIELDAATRWEGLEVLETVAGGAGDDAGEVRFRARWSDDGRRGALVERSRFVRRAGRWVYLDAAAD